MLFTFRKKTALQEVLLHDFITGTYPRQCHRRKDFRTVTSLEQGRISPRISSPSDKFLRSFDISHSIYHYEFSDRLKIDIPREN